jgi:hypothetical protein
VTGRRAAVPADPLIRASVYGTIAFTVVAVAAAIAPDALAVVAVVADLVLFTAGCACFALALLRAADRSREDELTLPGLFWLTGSAPAEVRKWLLGSFVVEVVVAFATAGARPFTGLAFGILVPVYGLGLVGLWGARAGTFPPRV